MSKFDKCYIDHNILFTGCPTEDLPNLGGIQDVNVLCESLPQIYYWCTTRICTCESNRNNRRFWSTHLPRDDFSWFFIGFWKASDFVKYRNLLFQINIMYKIKLYNNMLNLFCLCDKKRRSTKQYSFPTNAHNI